MNTMQMCAILVYSHNNNNEFIFSDSLQVSLLRSISVLLHPLHFFRKPHAYSILNLSDNEQNYYLR